MSNFKVEPGLEKVANAMSLIWAYISNDLHYRYVSPQFATWFKLPAKEIEGKLCSDFLGKKKIDSLSEYWGKALQGESVSFIETLHFEKEKYNFNVKANYIPKYENGKVDGFYMFYQGLTQENRTINTLRKLHFITSNSKSSLQEKIQKILKLGCITFDLPMAIVSHIIKDKYYVDYARTPEDALVPGTQFELGNTYCIHTLNANAPTAFHHAGASDIRTHPCYAEFGLESYIGVPLIVSDERYGTLNFSGPDIHGKKFNDNDFDLMRLLSQWVGNEITRDIDQNNLIRQQALLESMSQQARIGAWEVDLVKGVVYWSDMTREIHEVTKEFEPNLDTAINFYKEGASRDNINELLKRAIETGQPWNTQLQIVTAKGNEVWVSALGQVEQKDGESIRVFGSFQDIDSQVKSENELKKAKIEAEQAAKSKSEFLANMSHEIRTPLNGVLGMLHTALRNDLPNSQRRQLNIAQSSAESLLVLINDILDFSKVDAGKLDLEIIEFDIRQLFYEFHESMKCRFDEKNLSFNINLKSVTQSRVKGDPGRIRQILNNLVGNAIKFTHKGGVSLDVSLIEIENKFEMTCAITDTGIGIKQDKVSSLFDAFTQEDTSTTRKYGGTGLGLAIVTQLCHLMNGDINVESIQGKGSTFTFNLLMQAPEAPNWLSESETLNTFKNEQYSEADNNALSAIFNEHAKILLVEDNIINQEVAKELLSQLGLKADVADNGVHAISILNATLDGHYDLVLMDCQMPEMDGYQATTEIRNGKAGKEHMRVPIIALTANAMKGDRERCINAGMDDYLSKPIDHNLLNEVLIKHLT
jgi:signal transduction histidine kinase/CheY-like chemotaxis protein